MRNVAQNPVPHTVTNKDLPGSSRLLNRAEVEAEFRLSKRWLELAAVRGEGPPIVRISPRMVRYRACDIEAWIASCVDYGSVGDQ